MPETSELLCNAILEYENVVELECRIVMTVRVECDDRKADFFSKNLDWLLIFFGGW